MICDKCRLATPVLIPFPQRAAEYCEECFRDAQPPLQWTAEPPTQPGWYWVRYWNEVSFAEVSEWDGESLMINILGLIDTYYTGEDLSLIKLWYGPITPPALPGEVE